MNLLVFAGTTEGTAVTQRALTRGHTVTVSVATDYGADVLQAQLTPLSPAAQKRLCVLRGRLSAPDIDALVPAFDAVVDATHPYAAEVTAHLFSASRRAFVPYYRLLRPSVRSSYPRIREFSALPELVSALTVTDGTIFIATGSRDLTAFTALPDYQKRLFVRVLPSAESIEACRAVGIPPAHIIAMQGAFSTALNKALFAEYDCRVLVTKESGEAGGYAEKITAAEQLGMDVFALKPPAEPADSAHRFSSAEALLSALCQTDLLGTLTDFIGDGDASSHQAGGCL